MKVHIFMIVAFIGVTWGQQDIDDTIISIFGKNSTNDGGNTNVTSPPLKCGEGSQKNHFKCVPYYKCDSSNTQSDGIIDIRPDHESACDDYLEVCCRISLNNGTASSTTNSN